jgi:hypothetical protein
MTSPRPIDVTRKDGALVPRQKWLFDRLFEEGQSYTIEIHEPRSGSSHRHYFAAVHEAWRNLPEDVAKQHPDSEHLRKWSLIKTGWSIKRNVVCETVEQAHAIAALAGHLDESAVVVMQGKVVTIATARTQKTTGPEAMNREDFQKSKQDVLDYVASLIGVDASTLSSQVSDSSGQDPDTRTDAPAGECDPPSDSLAGANLSSLRADWREVYIDHMTNPRAAAASVMTRDTDALKMMGGEPSASEREWMRQVATLTNKRGKGKVGHKQFWAQLNELKAAPLPKECADA